MNEEIKLEEKLKKLQYHYNQFVDVYETLPPLSSMRKVILDDAISTIGTTMNGILNEINDMKFQMEQEKIYSATRDVSSKRWLELEPHNEEE